MATKLFLAFVLSLSILVPWASAQPRTKTRARDAAGPARPGTRASAGLRVAVTSIPPLPFPTPCLSASFGCCNRSLVAFQEHLDYLDSLGLDGVFNGPKECSTKMDVFVLSTGIEISNDAFRGVDMLFEPDCTDTSVNPTWTPNTDVDGSGTYLAGGLVAPYGVTPNVIVHSIKLSEYFFDETPASVLCGIGRVVSWLRDNPCRQAIVAMDMDLFQSQTSGVAPVNDAVSALVRDFGDRVVVITEFLRPNNYTLPAAILPEVLAVGSVFINPNGTLQPWGGPRTLSVDVWLVDDLQLSPKPNNTLDYVSAYDNDIGVISGVIAQYWVEHPQLTGNQLRRLIQDNAQSDLHVSGVLFDVPAGIPNKLLRYTCNGGCEPCLNGGRLLNTTGTLSCQCPQHTSGNRCDIVLCQVLRFGHPAYCERYYACSELGGVPLLRECGKQDGIQMYFDVPSASCKLLCEATPLPGCVARSC